MEENSDAELVRRFLDGEPAAFDALHRRHVPHVRGRLRRSGLGEADVADVAQEVFVRVFRSGHRFDGQRGAFGAWLAAITRNCMARHFARAGRTNSAPLAASPEPADPADPPPGDVVASAEETGAVSECVAALPVELRRIVQLRYAGGQTTRAIAARVGLSEASIRNRLAEAKAMLRRALAERGFLCE